jgi:hypothetical protein
LLKLNYVDKIIWATAREDLTLDGKDTLLIVHYTVPQDLLIPIFVPIQHSKLR